MKLVFFSDTHGKHEEVKLPAGDILIFCGDMCSHSSLKSIKNFAEFIAKQSYNYKIVIAGNHDRPFENEQRAEAEKIIHDAGAIYLNDSEIIIDGIKFWGSPVQPEFCDWAFNRFRGEEINKHWKKIPTDTDVLITHGPPAGILDRCIDGRQVGCSDLLLAVQKITPKIHTFGHIHEGYGVIKFGETTFINACNLDEKYQCVNEAIQINFESV